MKKHVLMVLVAMLAVAQNAFAYDFSVQSPSGHTLNYNIIDEHSVEVIVSDCTGDLIIPESVVHEANTYYVTTIGGYAFYYASGLTSIVIPNTVTTIRDYSFWNCDGLLSLNIPSSVTNIEQFAFYYFSAPNSITVESGNPVYDSREGCNAIIETATNTLIVGCKNTVIPNTVTSLAGYAFSNCHDLISITIPSSVTSIGSGAFEKCNSLTSIVIPASVTYVGSYAFNYCDALTAISVESGNTVYDSREDCNAVIKTATNMLVKGCMNTVIPSSVTSIGYYALGRCVGLTSVTFSSGVTAIGSEAFHGCSGLTSIECMAEVPPAVGYAALDEITTSIPVYVPCGKAADYQAAEGWSNFTNIQEVCGTTGTTGVSVYAEFGAVVVEGAAGNRVTLYDNAGNVLSTRVPNMNEPLRFESLTSGTYYVKIGILPSRLKVVVR